MRHCFYVVIDVGLLTSSCSYEVMAKWLLLRGCCYGGFCYVVMWFCNVDKGLFILLCL